MIYLLYVKTNYSIKNSNNFLVIQLYYLTQNQLNPADKLFILWVAR